MAYAETTKVPIPQTRAEIEALLKKAGATRIVTMDEPTEAVVLFMLAERMIRFRLTLDKDISDQARRARWRALLLTVKAKREAVESGIETVEEARLAHVVLPDNQTVSQWFEPRLRVAYQKGAMPTSPLMLEGPSPTRPQEAQDA